MNNSAKHKLTVFRHVASGEFDACHKDNVEEAENRGYMISFMTKKYIECDVGNVTYDKFLVISSYHNHKDIKIQKEHSSGRFEI